ncbi:MAG TPA: hypothetical protein VFI46_05500 [Jiangellaceae bacterium]|nr:hypothetical protein [Jiangellaceae bacterium]
MTVRRRTFLQGGLAAVAARCWGGPFQGFAAASALAGPNAKPSAADLLPIPDLRDGNVRLHLPAGFRYRSFHDTKFPVTLDDGTRLPGRHDGMAAFARGDGNFLLLRKHEENKPWRGVRPRHAVRRDGAGRHDHHRGDAVRRGRTCLHQPQRHDDELQRRPDAVGQLGQLRGDGQRPRRRT